MKKQRLLHIMMGKHNPDMQRGLDSIFECLHWDWTREFKEKEKPYIPTPRDRHFPHHLKILAELKAQSPKTVESRSVLLNTDLLESFNKFKPDIVFIHTQQAGIVSDDVVKLMKKTAIVINWTGDVRHPVPKHYKDFGKHIDCTLFTNTNDIDVLNSEGIKSDFLQVGFDSKQFTPVGDKGVYPEIIFMGSNYDLVFPLSSYRKLMVIALKKKYGDRVGIYGANWGELGTGIIDSYSEEGKAYRSCKIAISLSHFDIGRYASDRLFRILGSGAFCLSHVYKDIQEDFEVGNDLDCFDSIDGLMNKIDFYLENHGERTRIAHNGCKKAHKFFTWHSFAENLKKITDGIRMGKKN